MSTFWTNDRLDALYEQFAAGQTYSEIAEALRCSRSRIAGKCDRLGLVRDDATSRANMSRVAKARQAPLVAERKARR